MGYDLHITRANEWFEACESPIELQEWLAYIESDDEMRLDGFSEAKVKGKVVLRYENEGLAVWTAYSQLSEDGTGAWFDYQNGCIVVKNPDEEMIAKMKAIAAHFTARVIGDDGEEY